MSNYGKSVRKSGYWFGDGKYRGSTIRPNCGVLHTTETTGLPNYENGAEAPHYTAVPDLKSKKMTFVAHFPDEQSARALKNLPGGVETNTLNCIQIELVGTCDPGTHRKWGRTPHIYWADAPKWALVAVADFVADMHQRHGVPLHDCGKPWITYPASYGFSAKQRMSSTEWLKFTGWCGHQHVPENDHGDPGAIQWSKIQKFAKGSTDVTNAAEVAKTARKNINSIINSLDAVLNSSKKTHVHLRAARVALVAARKALPKEK